MFGTVSGCQADNDVNTTYVCITCFIARYRIAAKFLPLLNTVIENIHMGNKTVPELVPLDEFQSIFLPAITELSKNEYLLHIDHENAFYQNADCTKISIEGWSSGNSSYINATTQQPASTTNRGPIFLYFNAVFM